MLCLIAEKTLEKIWNRNLDSIMLLVLIGSSPCLNSSIFLCLITDPEIDCWLMVWISFESSFSRRFVIKKNGLVINRWVFTCFLLNYVLILAEMEVSTSGYIQRSTLHQAPLCSCCRRVRGENNIIYSALLFRRIWWYLKCVFSSLNDWKGVLWAYQLLWWVPLPGL